MTGTECRHTAFLCGDQLTVLPPPINASSGALSYCGSILLALAAVVFPPIFGGAMADNNAAKKCARFRCCSEKIERRQ